MSDDAKRFRDRAQECRAIATGIRNKADRALLEEIAEELEEEAKKIEQEQVKPDDAPA